MTQPPNTEHRTRQRVTYAALATLTIAIGLWVHRGITVMDADVRDVLGDALWAVMMVWWVSAVIPTARVTTRSGVALGICFAVEASQLLHTAEFDALRRTIPGRLVLGSGFDPRDLVAYALGVAVAVVLERVVVRRVLTSSSGG